MSVFKRGKYYFYEFVFQEKRIRESSKSTSKKVALAAEADRRRQLEKTLAGLPADDRRDRVKSVADCIRDYLVGYRLAHRPKSVLFAEGRLKRVGEALGSVLLPDLTEVRVREYMAARIEAGIAGRTINMEVGELSRAIGHPWSRLWPKVRKLEERKDVGRSLSPEEETRLLDECDRQSSPNRSRSLGLFLRVALSTGMRSGEISALRWDQIDIQARVITVGRAKTSNGTGRRIPFGPELASAIAAYLGWYAVQFGPLEAGWHLFPWGKPSPTDPKRHITDVTGAWEALRERAGVICRLHDLRHTAATKMAEAGIAESTMKSILGHMSQAMVERYSHIRMAAKREAVECLTLGRPNPPASPSSSQTIQSNFNVLPN